MLPDGRQVVQVPQPVVLFRNLSDRRCRCLILLAAGVRFLAGCLSAPWRDNRSNPVQKRPREHAGEQLDTKERLGSGFEQGSATLTAGGVLVVVLVLLIPLVDGQN